jgi:hypothetical protein
MRGEALHAPTQPEQAGKFAALLLGITFAVFIGCAKPLGMSRRRLYALLAGYGDAGASDGGAAPAEARRALTSPTLEARSRRPRAA